MLSKLAVVVSLGLSLVSPATGRQFPAPFFEETPVFVSGQDHINTYRIPALICSEKGTLLAFSEGRRSGSKDGVPTDIVLKRSVGAVDGVPRQGTAWRPMQTLIRSKHGEAYMNPLPLIDRTDGTIYLFVNYYPQPYADLPAEIWLLKSQDDGETWTGPVNITRGTGKHELGPSAGIQLHSGRLVAAVYDGVIFSDDHGKTWKPSRKATGAVSETQVVELVDGTLLLNRRGKITRRVMRSEDGGLTWSEPKAAPELPDADCQGTLIRYTREDDGYTKNRLLFANPVAGMNPKTIQTSDPRGRFNITVRLSYDEGKSWPVAKLVKPGPVAYSSMTVLPDGSIGMLYEVGDNIHGYFGHYQKVVFARFNLEWLTDGKDHMEKK